MKTEKAISATVVVVVAISVILSAGIPIVVPAVLPGVSIVTGDITEWQTGDPIDGSLVRLIDTATGEEVGNFTTRADGGYAIAVDFPAIGETMEAKITASKDGFHTNYTITTLTGLLPPETKTINLVLKEAIPPANVTNLTNITYEETYINWTWTDPVDADFSHVRVYLDGVFQENVAKGIQFFNATGLNDDTEYTIGTRTVDKAGNRNVLVTVIARTALTPDTTAPAISTPVDQTVEQDAVAKITWVITEENPRHFWVLRNGTQVKQPTTYMCGVDINVLINTTTLGVWNYTIVANDIAGNVASDQVIVTVKEPIVVLPVAPPRGVRVARDADGDGISDIDEMIKFGTDPGKADTDGGGMSDAEEIARGLNPLDPADDIPVPVVVPDPAEFEATNLVISPREVESGEAVTISATVRNIGDVEGTHAVTLRIDGIVIDTTSVTLAAGARETVTFTVTKDAVATYNVEVDGLTGNFVVEVPVVEPPEPPIPGFGAVLAIAGLLAVAAYAVLRRKKSRR